MTTQPVLSVSLDPETAHLLNADNPACKAALEHVVGAAYRAGWDALAETLRPIMEELVRVERNNRRSKAATVAVADTSEAPTVVVRLELGSDGVHVASMPARVTRRTVERDARGTIVGTTDLETDA